MAEHFAKLNIDEIITSLLEGERVKETEHGHVDWRRCGIDQAGSGGRL